MSELARFCGIIIAIYFRGEFGVHNTPHIHVSNAEHEASLAIADGSVLIGSLPRPALRLARDWLNDHRDEVKEAWRKARAGEPVGKIGSVGLGRRHRRSRRQS